MREQVQPEASFEHEDELESQLVQQVKARARNSFIALAVFVMFVGGLVLFRFYSTADLVADGQFYHDEVMSLQMFPFWKELYDEETSSNKQELIEEGDHKITRQELGRMGWTILHMVTGSFPEDIPPFLVKKFNTFLVLFGQFYPCKLCSGHFLKMLKEVGLFNGTKKVELMTYLCDMHNRVNKRLGKPIHSCKNVTEEWNTCGCATGR